ncbi:MAG: NADH-quinone oxidoreductase subunit NuoE [Chloroflexota bacterium]
MPEQIAEVLAPYRGQKGALIPVLQKVQEKLGYLSEAAISEIAEFLGLTQNEVFGVASFYAQFRFKRPGEHIISVCQGTACHVRGSQRIQEEVERVLDVRPGETTKDFKFGLERVACFGSCALAPVLVVDKTVYGRMTVAKARQILDEYRGKQ